MGKDAGQQWETGSPLEVRIWDDTPGLIYLRDTDHVWDHGADPIAPVQARNLAIALILAADVVEKREKNDRTHHTH